MNPGRRLGAASRRTGADCATVVGPIGGGRTGPSCWTFWLRAVGIGVIPPTLDGWTGVRRANTDRG